MCKIYCLIEGRDGRVRMCIMTEEQINNSVGDPMQNITPCVRGTDSLGEAAGNAELRTKSREEFIMAASDLGLYDEAEGIANE